MRELIFFVSYKSDFEWVLIMWKWWGIIIEDKIYMLFISCVVCIWKNCVWSFRYGIKDRGNSFFDMD